MFRAVLDTNVLVSARRSSGGASNALLRAVDQLAFTMLVSVHVFLEYEAVLSRPEQLAACGLRRRDIERVLDDIAAIATPVRLAFRWRPTLLDPADDMVLETAVNGGADAIVTFNLRHFEMVRQSFHCAVLSPGPALQHIGRRNS